MPLIHRTGTVTRIYLKGDMVEMVVLREKDSYGGTLVSLKDPEKCYEGTPHQWYCLPLRRVEHLKRRGGPALGRTPGWLPGYIPKVSLSHSTNLKLFVHQIDISRKKDKSQEIEKN